MIHFILERPQYTVSFVSSNLARRLHSRRLHGTAVTTRIPVCLLYPWPWWQANKTPGPVLQDVDDSADFDSSSHYNYYNGTFNSTPSINDFISQRERSGSNVICRCRIYVYLSVCAHLSPFFLTDLLSFSIIRGGCYFRGGEIFAYRWKAMEFRSSRDDLFYEQTRCRPDFLSPVVGWQRVTRVFAVYAAINCWRRSGRYGKVLKILGNFRRSEPRCKEPRFDLKGSCFSRSDGFRDCDREIFCVEGG